METLQKQSIKNELNDELIEKIDGFLSRQRREVLETVYAHKRISHKELAAGIGSTPTSLWNICQNFRSFQPALLKTEVQGRFKFYALTDIAAAYVEEKRRQEQERSRRTAVFPAVTASDLEDRAALEQCMSALTALDESWEVTLENYFVHFLCGADLPVGTEEKELIEKMLSAVRRLVFSDDQSGYDSFFDRYLQNPILQSRVEEYMKPFYCLEELRGLLEGGEHDAWDVYHMLDVIFGRDAGENGHEKLGFGKEAYGTLQKTLLWLRSREAGRSKEEVYRDLQGRFSCGSMLSIILADRIAGNA